ncbi:hypothetical protein LCGC14_1222640 [marine sediment metagenome]|uniref:HNH nuclease domain-containing protein n=1 Tax=marine sediment metagenome TaxID=412755 RepID=A0A0F9PF85_9ZZZZ|nr:HNH endonuclease [bacterium]
MEATIVKTKEGLNGKGGVVGTLALFECAICKIHWWDGLSQNRRFCSQGCYTKYKGRDNLIPLRRHIYNSQRWRDWRSAIFERDNFTCQLCEKRGGYLEADHYPISFSVLLKKYNIKSLEDSLNCEEMWQIDNGRTLCKDCHNKNKQGRPVIEKFL